MFLNIKDEYLVLGSYNMGLFRFNSEIRLIVIKLGRIDLTNQMFPIVGYQVISHE